MNKKEAFYLGIGKILYDLIKEKKTNVNEIAKNANISPSTLYSMIRRDSMKVDIDVLIRVSKVLGVTADYFYEIYEQGCISDKVIKNTNLSESEEKHIKKYRALDERGKKTVDNILDEQYEYVRPKVTDMKVM